jgi:hypothetical protein
MGMRTGCERMSVSSLGLLVALSVAGSWIGWERTSHELEGHGHALLVVRHVCGISRGV